MNATLKYYWTSIVLVLMILVLCFMNPPELPVEVSMSNFDKFVHFMMFSTLSGVVFWNNTFYFKRKISSLRLFFGSFVFPLVFSGLIEIGQEYLTSTRTGDWVDFLFDGIGTLLGWIVCGVLNGRKKGF